MAEYPQLSRARLKALTALGVKKFRRRERAFLVEGETLLREAIGAGWEVLEVIANGLRKATSGPPCANGARRFTSPTPRRSAS
jgi:tRNA G18 (ribose-2'-O)-methylase SpoU